MNLKKSLRSRAFSLAEIMVVMLMVCIFLVAMMPIMTKHAKAPETVSATGSLPVGTIVSYYGTTAPSGWLLCNGTSTNGYAQLKALVGNTTPDLRGRVLVGRDAAKTIIKTHDATQVGKYGGEENHILSISEMPAHHHVQTKMDDYASRSIDGWSLYQSWRSSGGGNKYNIHVLTQDTGSGTAHENMQPYFVLNYIIKY